MSDNVLVDGFMAGKDVAPIFKGMCDNLDPKQIYEALKDMDKAFTIAADQKKLSDGEVVSILCYGESPELLKGMFAKKLMESGNYENIAPLLEQKVKLYTMMNANKELPLSLPKEQNGASVLASSIMKSRANQKG